MNKLARMFIIVNIIHALAQLAIMIISGAYIGIAFIPVAFVAIASLLIYYA